MRDDNGENGDDNGDNDNDNGDKKHVANQDNEEQNVANHLQSSSLDDGGRAAFLLSLSFCITIGKACLIIRLLMEF